MPVPARDDAPADDASADVDQWGLSPVVAENFAQQALEEFRPPLANQLFAMDRDVHRAAAVACERVAPALPTSHRIMTSRRSYMSVQPSGGDPSEDRPP